MRPILLFFLVLAGILTATAVYTTLSRKVPSNELTLYGNVDVRQVDLSFRVSGRVDALLYQEGDLVPKGKLVSTLDTQPYRDEVRQARAAVLSAKATLRNSKILLKRREQLLTIGGASQEDYDNAQASRDVAFATLRQAQANLGVALTALSDTRAFAPEEGILLTRIREPGSVVRQADPVCTLSLTSPVWIRAYVSEPYLGVVYPGMAAEIHTDTEGGPVYVGHVGFISPVAEFTPKTVETTELRTDLVYRLRIYADNPDKGLRQGMPVTVKLQIRKKA